ncbi:collagen alpha-1(I) chain-like [Tachyglossus aculeatus]|uniref:collagen alpha-1(I) chain-like n=1 Tax=Tachyglossus aculeatus TaxID=9261 RepID=UPI0018F65097|nr:collagen alpha-1(I) chain-like [Tachyglossus aculeatus]
MAPALAAATALVASRGGGAGRGRAQARGICEVDERPEPLGARHPEPPGTQKVISIHPGNPDIKKRLRSTGTQIATKKPDPSREPGHPENRPPSTRAQVAGQKARSNQKPQTLRKEAPIPSGKSPDPPGRPPITDGKTPSRGPAELPALPRFPRDTRTPGPDRQGSGVFAHSRVPAESRPTFRDDPPRDVEGRGGGQRVGWPPIVPRALGEHKKCPAPALAELTSPDGAGRRNLFPGKGKDGAKAGSDGKQGGRRRNRSVHLQQGEGKVPGDLSLMQPNANGAERRLGNSHGDAPTRPPIRHINTDLPGSQAAILRQAAGEGAGDAGHPDPHLPRSGSGLRDGLLVTAPPPPVLSSGKDILPPGDFAYSRRDFKPSVSVAKFLEVFCPSAHGWLGLAPKRGLEGCPGKGSNQAVPGRHEGCRGPRSFPAPAPPGPRWKLTREDGGGRETLNNSTVRRPETGRGRPGPGIKSKALHGGDKQGSAGIRRRPPAEPPLGPSALGDASQWAPVAVQSSGGTGIEEPSRPTTGRQDFLSADRYAGVPPAPVEARTPPHPCASTPAEACTPPLYKPTHGPSKLKSWATDPALGPEGDWAGSGSAWDLKDTRRVSVAGGGQDRPGALPCIGARAGCSRGGGTPGERLMQGTKLGASPPPRKPQDPPSSSVPWVRPADWQDAPGCGGLAGGRRGRPAAGGKEGRGEEGRLWLRLTGFGAGAAPPPRFSYRVRGQPHDHPQSPRGGNNWELVTLRMLAQRPPPQAGPGEPSQSLEAGEQHRESSSPPPPPVVIGRVRCCWLPVVAMVLQ